MLKKTFYRVLIVLGAVGIAATINAIFVSTGIHIGTILPGTAGVVFIAYALIKLLRPGNIIKVKALRIAVTIVICLGILLFIVIEAVIIVYAGASEPERDANFVVVPGCGIYSDGHLTLVLKERLDTAYSYLLEHKNAICIVSGGQGDNEPYSEAYAMKRYLVSKGIDGSRIIEEGESHDTNDNMAFSAEIMEEMYPGRYKSTAVITSGFHVFRSLMLAEKYGMYAFGVSAPIPWYMILNDYMRESIGIAKMVLIDLK